MFEATGREVAYILSMDLLLLHIGVNPLYDALHSR